MLCDSARYRPGLSTGKLLALEEAHPPTAMDPRTLDTLGYQDFGLQEPSPAGAAATPDMFRPVSDRLPDYMETEGRRNLVGPAAVAVPVWVA